MGLLLSVGLAYLIGSLPIDEWLFQQHRKFILASKKEVLVYILLDMCKGMLATSIALFLSGWLAASVAAIAVVWGSMYSLFDRFRGGNGMSVAAGALFVLSPVLIMLGILIYVVSLFVTRYTSLSAMLTTIVVMILALFLVSQMYVWLVVFSNGGIILYRQKRHWKGIKVHSGPFGRFFR